MHRDDCRCHQCGRDEARIALAEIERDEPHHDGYEPYDLDHEGHYIMRWSG